MTVWIAEDATEVLGSVAVRPVPADEGSMLKPAGTVELIVAATLPKVRGTGIGRILCERALTECAAQEPRSASSIGGPPASPPRCSGRVAGSDPPRTACTA